MDLQHKDIQKDNRDAIPSWNGYIYQGEVALITLLEKLLEIKEDDVSNYFIGIEDIEDFSLYFQNRRISIHQVKAEQKRSIDSYKEAIYKLAESLSKLNDSEVMAYLHISQPLEGVSMDKIPAIVQRYQNDQIQKWKQIVNDSKKFEEEFKLLKNGITKNYQPNKTIRYERRTILEIAMSIKNLNEFTEEIAIEAINQYINCLKDTSFKPELLKRIEVYTYRDKNNYLSDQKALEYMEKLLYELWGKFGIIGREDKESQYRLLMQENVTRHIHERSKNSFMDKKMEFTIFSKLLKESVPTSGEQRLLNEKEFLVNESRAYCENCNKNKEYCSNCDVYKAVMWITSAENKELFFIAYMLSPNKKENILKQTGVHIFEELGLSDSTFLVLQKFMDKAQMEDFKIIYCFESIYYMLTSIYCSAGHKKLDALYTKISDNTNIENICDEIEKDREFAIERMEIDALIFGYDASNEWIDVDECCHHLIHSSSEERQENFREPSYAKITNKKKLYLMPASGFISKYGGSKDE